MSSAVLSDQEAQSRATYVSILRGLRNEWIAEDEFKLIIERAAGIPAWDHAHRDAVVIWVLNLGQVERRVDDDGSVYYRRHPSPPPLNYDGRNRDLNQQAAQAAALEREAHEAEARSGRWANPQYAELRAVIREVALELWAELTADDDTTDTQQPQEGHYERHDT